MLCATFRGLFASQVLDSVFEDKSIHLLWRKAGLDCLSVPVTNQSVCHGGECCAFKESVRS